jgi:tetratricopeptide (TPR) repeat protein
MPDPRSRPRLFPLPIALAVLTLIPLRAAAQIPDEFTNLKLLPEDITREELVATMREWAGALGVRCAHCHVGPDDLQGMDFATDEREAKRETREMLVLTRAINDDYLDAAAGQAVTCYTCHHALPSPPRSTGEELAAASKRRGVAGAIARFRELHDWYYGTGRYDLSASGLVGVAEGYLEAGQGDDALQMLALGLELFPESADVHAGYGHAYVALEQPERARESFEKALAIDRRNRSARRGLRDLQAGEDQ